MPSDPASRRIAAPKGVHDILGAEAARFEMVERLFYDIAARYGYGPARIPVFEETELFVRGVGAATDVVRKEMYSFTDRGDRSLTLRPEGTAGMVRCFVEHHLDQAGLPWKAAYGGAMFRAENVQRGRQRQFHQVGVEAIGVDDPDLDVEVIALGWRFLAELGLSDVTLLVNSIGRPNERSAYVEDLRDHVRASGVALGPDDSERIELNPMRLLDSKDPRLEPVLAAAPKLSDHLDAESKVHFEAVLAGLDELAIAYTVDHGLVRGLDYYTSTTFEYASGALEAAQNALGGGGHYDGLVEMIGGAALPGIGFAFGIERIVLALDAEGLARHPAASADVVVLSAGDVGPQVRRLVDTLRSLGVRTDRPFGGRSLKAQFKFADRSGAAWAVIVGERDLADGAVTVRDLRSGDEERVPVGEAAARIAACTGHRESD